MKYECSYCGDSLKPCVVGHDDRRPLELLGICPFRRHARPRWKQVSDKPPVEDPAGSSADPVAGGIVELIDRELPEWVWREKFKKVAQAIEARDNALEAEIGAVRNEITENIRPILAAFDLQYESIGRLKRKVESLREEIDEAQEQRDEQYERLDNQLKKITRLEMGFRKHEQRKEHLSCIQPQDAERGAQAPDSDGKMHKLIPGVSVCTSSSSGLQSIFHHRDDKEENDYGYLAFTSGSSIDSDLTSRPSDKTIWVCDLDFPATNPGGDK